MDVDRPPPPLDYIPYPARGDFAKFMDLSNGGRCCEMFKEVAFGWIIFEEVIMLECVC